MLEPRTARKLRSFAKKVGRGIHRFHMIDPGDRILIGVSGGKDSLALAVALNERRRWVPIAYELAALFIEWKEYPLGEERRRRLAEFFRGLGIPLRIVTTTIQPPSFRGEFSCYLCSRNRKRILFDEAGRTGVRKIALGHHMDDVIETTLMNLLFRGEVATMMPVQQFFQGRLAIIRPMCEVREREVSSFARRYELPTIETGCPRKELNRRRYMKELIRGLERINPRVVENVYRAPFNINRAYLPGDPPESLNTG
jgi:tRNA 2-thiocytidine biosynthesis protein TtcA